MFRGLVPRRLELQRSTTKVLFRFGIHMGIRFNRLGGPASQAAMRRERLLFLGGGTLLFSSVLIATLLIVQSQSVQAKPKEISVEPLNEEVALGTVVLLAANSKIPKGTKLTPAYIREVHWPRDQVPEGAVRKIDDIENMFTTASLVENQPILRGSLAANPPSLGIGDLLTPGMRAVTINVNATSGIEGWATPGAHVDVLLTYMDPKDAKNTTIVAVENAVVLSYGGSAKTESNDDMDRDKNLTSSTTATLAVSVEDSLKIQTAIAMGRITLALRSVQEIGAANVKEFKQDQWDQSHRTQQADKKPIVNNGYAKVPGKDGSARQYVLSPDGKWQNDTPEDELY